MIVGTMNAQILLRGAGSFVLGVFGLILLLVTVAFALDPDNRQMLSGASALARSHPDSLGRR